ncbi:MAG: PAQR family membrane homeostasis protein TrhA [Acidimicrobiales bacterium]
MVVPQETSVAGAKPETRIDPKPSMRGWLHVGAVLVLLVAGPILISNARSTGSRVALTVYVASLLTLFGVSSLLHRGHWGPKGTRRMRRADHSTIFVGIAGSYSAVAELALSGTVRVVVLALVWGGAVVGILIRQLLLDAPQWVVALPYVVVGWSALAVTPQLVRGASWPGFLLVLAGGLVYTLGAVVYALKRPNPVPSVFGFHEVFHTCTVIGATVQFIAIAYFLLPRT